MSEKQDRRTTQTSTCPARYAERLSESRILDPGSCFISLRAEMMREREFVGARGVFDVFFHRPRHDLVIKRYQRKVIARQRARFARQRLALFLIDARERLVDPGTTARIAVARPV